MKRRDSILANYYYSKLPKKQMGGQDNPDVGEFSLLRNMSYGGPLNAYFTGKFELGPYNAKYGGPKPKGKSKKSEPIERKVDRFLGYPQDKARRDSQMPDWFNPKTRKWEKQDEVDNLRHSSAGRYTAEAIANKFPSWMQYTPLPKVTGLVGSNLLGLGHELGSVSNNPNYSTWDKIREGGEDMINNFVGSLVGSVPFMSDENKTKTLQYLSDNNLLPDGYGAGNMYFKQDGGSAQPSEQEWLTSLFAEGLVEPRGMQYPGRIQDPQRRDTQMRNVFQGLMDQYKDPYLVEAIMRAQNENYGSDRLENQTIPNYYGYDYADIDQDSLIDYYQDYMQKAAPFLEQQRMGGIPKYQKAGQYAWQQSIAPAASESTAIRYNLPTGPVSTATTGMTKKEMEESSKAMAKARKAEEEEKKRRIAERKSAVAARDKGASFTLPTGETKKYEDMNAREKMYVSGKALEQRGRFSEDDESFFDEWLNPLNMIGSMASGLGTAPYVAKQTNSNLPYLTGLISPLVGGAIAGVGTKTTKQFLNNTFNPLAGVSIKRPFKSDLTESLNNTSSQWGPRPNLTYNGIPARDLAIESRNTIENEGRKMLETLSSPEGVKRLRNQFAKTNPKLTDEQLDHLVTTRINEVSSAINYNEPRFWLEKGEGAKGSPTEDLIGELLPIGNAHWTPFNPYPLPYVKPPAGLFPPEVVDPNVITSTQPGTLNLIKLDKILGKDFLNPNFSPGSITLGSGHSKRLPTLAHEIGHAIQRGDTMPIDIDLVNLTKKKGAIDHFWRKYMLRNPEKSAAYKYFNKPKGGSGRPNEPYPYLREQRQKMIEQGIIPHEYANVNTLDLLKSAWMSRNEAASATNSNRLLKIIAPWKYGKLAKIFNEAPAVVPIIGGASVLANSDNEQQYGGLIEDNRGQWAYPGQNTRISSPNITMEGVPYPVLAKANNGQQVMMQPGQDYYFPGAQYVDEYPMMQKGGWLDKFQDGGEEEEDITAGNLGASEPRSVYTQLNTPNTYSTTPQSTTTPSSGAATTPVATTPAAQSYAGLNPDVSIVDYLKYNNLPSDMASRAKLATEKGISGYRGTAEQNMQLLNILKQGQTGTTTPAQTKTQVANNKRATKAATKSPTNNAEYVNNADLRARLNLATLNFRTGPSGAKTNFDLSSGFKGVTGGKPSSKPAAPPAQPASPMEAFRASDKARGQRVANFKTKPAPAPAPKGKSIFEQYPVDAKTKQQPLSVWPNITNVPATNKPAVQKPKQSPVQKQKEESSFFEDLDRSIDDMQDYLASTVDSGIKNINDAYNTAKDYGNMGINYLKRKYDLLTGDDENTKSSVRMNTQPVVVKKVGNEEEVIDNTPAITIGNKIVDPDRGDRFYHVPEIINLDKVKFGYRNRGEAGSTADQSGVTTAEGLIITPFATEYSGNKKSDNIGKSTIRTYKDSEIVDNQLYGGIDDQGKFILDFGKNLKGKNLKMADFRYTDVTGFAKDKNGKIIMGNETSNKGFAHVPHLKTVDGKEKPLNFLVPKRGSKQDETFGKTTGGRMILATPDMKTKILVSGSLKNVDEALEDFKKKYKTDKVRVVFLDNGTYSRGLRTKDKKISKQDFINYDINDEGGAGFYYYQDGGDVSIPNLSSPVSAYKTGGWLDNYK